MWAGGGRPRLPLGARQALPSKPGWAVHLIDIKSLLVADDRLDEVDDAPAHLGILDAHERLGQRETLELVRAYYKIRESRVRKRIFEMVKAVGAASHAEVLGGRKGR